MLFSPPTQVNARSRTLDTFHLKRVGIVEGQRLSVLAEPLGLAYQPQSRSSRPEALVDCAPQRRDRGHKPSPRTSWKSPRPWLRIPEFRPSTTPSRPPLSAPPSSSLP